MAASAVRTRAVALRLDPCNGKRPTAPSGAADPTQTVCAQRYGFRRCHVRPCDAARTRRPRTSVLRNPGHPRSKPLELPLLGHRARSCRSRSVRRHYARTTCATRLHPRCASPSETPGTPVTSKAPTLERFLPEPPGSPASRHVSVPGRQSRALPSAGMGHIPCPPGFAAHPDDAERGAESFPLSLRRSGGCPPPTCLQAPSPVAGGHAVSGVLTLTEPLGRTSVPPNDVPDRSSDVSPFPARRRITLPSLARMGRHIEGGASALRSAADLTTPGPAKRAAPACPTPSPRQRYRRHLRGRGALCHEPVTA